MRPISKIQAVRMFCALLSFCLLLAFQGCGAFRLHNKDKSMLGSHPVSIAPCGWKFEDKFSGQVKDEQTGKLYYKYSCGKTLVTIKDEELTVNGKSYGKLAGEKDSVKVSGSKVLINDKEVQAMANVAGNGM